MNLDESGTIDMDDYGVVATTTTTRTTTSSGSSSTTDISDRRSISSSSNSTIHSIEIDDLEHLIVPSSVPVKPVLSQYRTSTGGTINKYINIRDMNALYLNVVHLAIGKKTNRQNLPDISKVSCPRRDTTHQKKNVKEKNKLNK